jgi:malate dehydrogenase
VRKGVGRSKTGDRPLKELVTDHNWLKNEFIAAGAACDHIRDWFLGTPKGTWVSMGVCSDGSYGIPPGLVYSFPVICEKGSWKIVQGLSIDEFSREKMDDSARELAEEKDLAYSCLNV